MLQVTEASDASRLEGSTSMGGVLYVCMDCVNDVMGEAEIAGCDW
jgi:hypothetical protein